MKLPVLIMAFNRVDTLKVLIPKIKDYSPEILYIAIDGPRENKEGDDKKVKYVVDFIISSIDWKCEIKTLIREKNLGCKLAVSSAITWFFDNEEMGVVLEDDTIPNDSFFKFCEELLYKYRNDERIGIVSGSNLALGYRRNEDSYFFSKYTIIWGWASWSRVWKNYDVNISKFDTLVETKKMQDLFSDVGERKYWDSMWGLVKSGALNTWDLQFGFANFINNRLNIIPSVNLITNIGFGEDATHTYEKVNPFANLPAVNLDFPLKHPDFFLEDHLSERSLKKYFRVKNFFGGLLNRIWKR